MNGAINTFESICLTIYTVQNITFLKVRGFFIVDIYKYQKMSETLSRKIVLMSKMQPIENCFCDRTTSLFTTLA